MGEKRTLHAAKEGKGESLQRLRRRSDLVSDHSGSTTLSTDEGEGEVWEARRGKGWGSYEGCQGGGLLRNIG